MKIAVPLAAFAANALILFPSAPSLAQTPPIRLSETEISQQLQSLPGWTREGQSLRCTYQLANFVEAIAFINRIVAPAEAAAHHPDVAIAYNKVTLTLSTHDAGGLTALDFQVAQQIAQLGSDTTPPLRCLQSSP